MSVKHICHTCVGDPYLKEEIKAGGSRKLCMGCGRTRAALPLNDLAYRIDDGLWPYFYAKIEGEGDDYATIVAEEAGLSKALATAVQTHMSSTRGFTEERDGEYNTWRDAVFVRRPIEDDESYRARWAEFRRSIAADARHFNQTAEVILADIFKDVEAVTSWMGVSPIHTFEPSGAAMMFMRGRNAKSEGELIRVLEDPAAQIGPPPTNSAKAFRMNASGVSVFYGAHDTTTCRVECRPPVVSWMVYGGFELLRTIRVLDIAALAMAEPQGSIFAPCYAEHHARTAFLRRLNYEISMPVMPGDEEVGYLHTQAVADYLAQRLRFDGAYYRSAQSGTNFWHGRSRKNLVLFHHAARVEPSDRSGITTVVDLGWEEGDAGFDMGIEIEDIVEKAESPPPPAEEKISDPLDVAVRGQPQQADPDTRPFKLRLVPDTVSVERILATDYKIRSRSVSRARVTREDVDNLPF